MKKLTILLAAVMATIVVAMPITTYAINYGGIGGVPANPRPDNPRTKSIFIYKLKPGQSATDGIKLQNSTGKQQTVDLDAVDSALSSGGAFTCMQSADKKTDAGAWIMLSQSAVTMGPNTTKIIPFTVTVPKTDKVDVGEHDGCITIQAASQTAKQSQQNGIVLSFRSAIRLVVTIPGKIIKKLTIDKVGITKNNDGSYQVTPVATNSGNVSLDTKLTINTVTMFGNSLATIKEGTTPILPRTTASWNYKLKKPFWGGFYKAQVVATYNSNPNSELGVNTDATPVTITKSSSSFFVMPSPLALLIELAVLLGLIGVVVWFVRKKLHKKHVKKTWETYTMEEGDTLQRLAKEFNVPWKKIASVNKLKPPYELHKGQKLKLPPETR
jgi:hypothetical protein